jgi:uncharacterized protein
MDMANADIRFLKWIVVQAYKHDGLLHREWSPAYLVKETDDWWALASQSSLVTEKDGRRWMTKEHAIFILYKHEWKNIICMMKENGICYYVNVASPTIRDEGYLRYIDYDLDVKLFPDGGIRGLDEQEFERHVLTYGYPPDLTNAIKRSFHKIQDQMLKKTFPYQSKDITSLFAKFLDENRPFFPKKS